MAAISAYDDNPGSLAYLGIAGLGGLIKLMTHNIIKKQTIDWFYEDNETYQTYHDEILESNRISKRDLS